MPPDVALPSPADLARAWTHVDEAARRLLTGDQLVHGDLASCNVLVENGRARLVDWAWSMRGPCWVDGVLWGMRLVSEGCRDPADAARRVARLPGWSSAPIEGVRVFARAEAAHWASFARDDPVLDSVRDAARTWADYWDSR